MKNPISALTGLFKRAVGAVLKKAFGAAVGSGLTDVAVKMALDWVRVAAVQFADNAEKRRFVIDILVSRGIPESLARLALELAVQLFKQELLSAKS